MGGLPSPDAYHEQMPLEQVCPDGHAVPQAPQLLASSSSEAHMPEQQLSPDAQSLSATQATAAPHTFGTPLPPHVCPDEHVPQSRLPPHPSDTVPQSALMSMQARGTQPVLVLPPVLELEPAPPLPPEPADMAVQAPPVHAWPVGQSLSSTQWSPQKPEDPHASPLGQSVSVAQVTGWPLEPMGTLLVVHAPKAARATTAPKGIADFQSERV